MHEGFFKPDSAIWRVDREMALLLGGGRALLMQLAHPKIAAGVADHSHFQEDPLGRLHRTMDTMWSIVFDEISKAEVSLQRVREIHNRVQGNIKEGEGLPAGTVYDARDPDLLLWVHATLVDSALHAYELFVHPLAREDKSRYYEDTKNLALLFEVPEDKIPASLEAFNRYTQEMIAGDELSVGRRAKVLSREILHPRPLTLKFGAPIFALVTAGLLPRKLREAYGLKWDERRERRFKVLASCIRRLLPFVPRGLRIVPRARTAERRLRRLGPSSFLHV